MRSAIKMILLQAAKGLGKPGDEIEVATPEQAEYFEERGIASRDAGAGSLPASDSDPDAPPAAPELKQPPQPPSTKKSTTKKNEKDH